MISLTSCRRAFSASWVQAPQTFYSQCKGKLVLTTQQMQVYSLEDSDQLAELSQGVQREACADDRADTGERARGRDQLDELSEGDPFSLQRQICADDRADAGERARGRDQLDELSDGDPFSCRKALDPLCERRLVHRAGAGVLAKGHDQLDELSEGERTFSEFLKVDG
eukprot:TRINITY_DN10427_c0_g1_i7.p1 TRINITY_DN10427_c0_g1~~TRINITY_DN10427_c0_g1_i7.p1  ORF type:complete len:168 (+),score=18.22 TRINITY_DN10427_c0_g1_i7:391-894(+)